MPLSSFQITGAEKTELTLILTAFLLEHIAVADVWEQSWRRFTLTAPQLATAKQRLDRAYLAIDAQREKFLNDFDIDKDLPPLYEPLDFANSEFKESFKRLCKLYFMEPSMSGDAKFYSPSKASSCFFVKPNVVMTSGHSFFTPVKDAQWNQIIMEAEKEVDKNHVVYVVHQYGAKGIAKKDQAAHAKHTRDNAQLALEWWTPAAFKGLVGPASGPWKSWKLDMAFLKVANPVNEDSVYTLGVPNDKTKAGGCNMFSDTQKLFEFGYPGDAASGEIPVNVLGFLMPYSDKWKDFITASSVAVETVAKRNGKEVSGDMQHGGSGGPWVVARKRGDKKMAKCDRRVFGLTSRGRTELNLGISPKFSKELVVALDKIAQLPAGVKLSTTDKNAAGATVVSEEGESIQLVDFKMDKIA